MMIMSKGSQTSPKQPISLDYERHRLDPTSQIAEKDPNMIQQGTNKSNSGRYPNMIQQGTKYLTRNAIVNAMLKMKYTSGKWKFVNVIVSRRDWQ